MDSPLASLAEARIQESLEAGAELNLPGAGKPLDLEGYFSAPSALRAGFGLLKSAGVVPPEVEAIREVARLRERLAAMPEGTEKERLRVEWQAREVELAMALERMRRQLRADAVG